MQMRVAIVTMTCAFVAADLSAASNRVDVLSRNICISGVNGLSYSVSTAEDFSFGKISIGRRGTAVDYYIGSHPDDSGIVSSEPLNLRNLPDLKAEIQRHKNGTTTVAVIPPRRPRGSRDMVVLGPSENLLEDGTFNAVIGRIRWCKVAES